MARRNGILPGYRGHIDAVEPVLSGWVAEIARPAAPVRFFLSVDWSEPIEVVADRARVDVAAAGLASPDCGFSIDLPGRLLDGAEHDLALLLSGGRSLNLPGRPRRVALGPVCADLIPPSAVSLDAVAGLLRQNDFEAGFDPDLVALEHAAAFNAHGSSDRGFLFYARAGHRLVGYGRLDRHRSDAGVLGVVALTVLEAYRRKGIGEALLRALLWRAAEPSSLCEVWLSVRPDNTPALGLYDKCGFVREASHPAGQWAVCGEITMVWMPRGWMPRVWMAGQARPG
jgi:ribosomal protein S18 acetylase RimI-like enzyme